jgi:hypothetical protein
VKHVLTEEEKAVNRTEKMRTVPVEGMWAALLYVTVQSMDWWTVAIIGTIGHKQVVVGTVCMVRRSVAANWYHIFCKLHLGQ